MEVGDYGIIRKTFTKQDLQQYQKFLGDEKPPDADETRSKILKKDFVYGKLSQILLHSFLGALASSMFSKVYDHYFPAAIYASQHSSFLKPIYLDEEV